MTVLTIFVVLLLGYSLVSRRLEDTILSGPILFTLAGIGTAISTPAELAAAISSEFLLHLAEIGLVLLLFTDAGRTDLSLLRTARSFPARLLGIGLPLTIVLGALAGWLMFPALSFWEVAILAATLAPTDAGLGQVIVVSSRVPVVIRQALNVEAGLNDGLSVPFLLFFIALAAASEGTSTGFMQFVVEQLGYGVAVGGAIGLGGGVLLGWATQRGWMSNPFRQTGILTLPVLCLIASAAVSASAFIAAFVAGLALQVGFSRARARDMTHGLEFDEISGQIINLAVFFLFGMVVVRFWGHVDGFAIFYAALSLTVVRMLPVALALSGSGLSRSTVLFMGWFGPRGLASIVLGLIYLEREIHLPGESTIRAAIIATVLLSILAHGVSAPPGIGMYARRLCRLDLRSPERSGEL
jgi:NhaP-type Na+/H+ or K+/H+ antiporter